MATRTVGDHFATHSSPAGWSVSRPLDLGLTITATRKVPMKILITGGAGYIGSTVGSACEEAGHEVVVLDDLSAGRREFVRDRTFYQGDIADQDLLDRVFTENQIDAVVHLSLIHISEPTRPY